MDELEFPFLGTEAIATEFANTDYGSGNGKIDFLRTPALVARWFALAHSVLGIAAPPSAMHRNADRVRSLRDAIRAVLTAVADGAVPSLTATNLVNEAATGAPTFMRLDWPSEGGPTVHRLDATSGSKAVLGRIATSCIELAADRTSVVRRCETSDCSMLFGQHHSHRRFCHPSCSHRGRQARYYRRSVQKGSS